MNACIRESICLRSYLAVRQIEETRSVFETGFVRYIFNTKPRLQGRLWTLPPIYKEDYDMKKKVLAALLSATMIMSLAACGGEDTSTGATPTEAPKATEAPAAPTEAPAAPTEAPAPETEVVLKPESVQTTPDFEEQEQPTEAPEEQVPETEPVINAAPENAANSGFFARIWQAVEAFIEKLWQAISRLLGGERHA
jgi:hypothetical protein